MEARGRVGTLDAMALFERIRSSLNQKGSKIADSSELHELLRRAELLLDIEICREGGMGETCDGRGKLGRGGEGEGAWPLLLAKGHLAIAASCTEREDLIRVNAEKKAMAVFQRAFAKSSSQGCATWSIFDLACLLAKHHYETAVGLVAGESMGQALQRRALHHCGESVRYGECALQSSTCADQAGSLESTVEIRTMLHHARVMQADCMVAIGMLVDASRVLGMLPDWSKAREHMVWYSEELLVRMRLYVGSDMSETLAGSLKELGLLVRGASPDDFAADDRLFLGKRLGRVLEGMMRRFGGCVGGGRSQCLDGVLFLVEAAPDVGVEALLGVVSDGLQGENDSPTVTLDSYDWSKFLCDVMLAGSVRRLVRTRQSAMEDIVSVFQVASSRTFVVGDVDMSITYAQLVQMYGPESRRQWGYAMSYALQVYKAFVFPKVEQEDGARDDGAMVQAQESFQVLDEATRSHPFVMAVRLLHLKERRAITQQRDVYKKTAGDGDDGDEIGEIDEAATAELREAIATAATRGPPAWSRDYTCAIQEIDSSILQMEQADGDGILERLIRAKDPCQALDALVVDARAAAEEADRRLEALHSEHAQDNPRNLLRMIMIALQVVMVSAMEHESTEEAVELQEVALRMARVGLKLIGSGGCGSENAKGVLDKIHFRLRLLSCNACLDALLLRELGDGDTPLDQGLQAIRLDIEELAAAIHDMDLPIVLLALRYALLSGDFALMKPGDFPIVWQLIGSEEHFLELISVHLRALGDRPVESYIELLQFIVENISGGLEAILLSLALSGDGMSLSAAYRIYATAIRHLVNLPPTLGEAIMSTNETAPVLAAKICMVEPHLAGFICDWNEDVGEDGHEDDLGEDAEDGEEPVDLDDLDDLDDLEEEDDDKDEIEEITTKSMHAQPSPSQEEIESPATETRKRKLSAAGHIISGLLDDLASSDDATGVGRARRDATRDQQAAPWIDWIKRVFSP